MSSEPVTDIRSWLREQLQATTSVPETWDIQPGLPTKIGKLARPTVYLEYTTFDPTTLPTGHVAAGIDLLVFSPLEDRTKAEDDVDDLVLDLVLGLDELIDNTPNLSWRGESATKEQLADTAYIGWRIKIQAIASLTRPPAPAPEPETPEE